MSSREALSHAPVFEALIVPHRSMTCSGIVLVAVAVLTLTMGVGLRFLFLGAWPVIIFSGLEVPLMGVLLAINLRRAKASELILLDQRQITVTRTDPGGHRTSFSLPTAWLQVNLESNRGGSRVIVSSHGSGHEIGGFLHEPDKASLFEALRGAVHDVRHPIFDNPQLRDL
jgi:uncharacterized membrane protein